jgi:hypothetical protein
MDKKLKQWYFDLTVNMKKVVIPPAAQKCPDGRLPKS